MKKIATICMLIVLIMSVAWGNLVINEILADPPSDANGDGVFSTDDDEFVELFNNSNESLNISGWYIRDITAKRFTFEDGTVIPANGCVVVFGGGNPTGSFGGAQVFTDDATLSLNNGTETISVCDELDNVIVFYTYTSAPTDQSLTRNPDITGDFYDHSIVSPGVLYSPGYKNDGETSLPVTLSSFTATAINGSVEIEWTTESEVNNLGFNLYRSESEDGTYEKIAGLIEGAGNASTKNTYKYTDTEVVAGRTYYYQLEDVSTTGKTVKHDVVSVIVEESTANAAMEFQLHAAYPNPCNPTTNIMFDVPKQSLVTLRIFDLQGRLVKNLVNENKSVGNYKVNWNGTDSNNNPVGNGVYLYQLTTGTGFNQTNKVILLK